MTLLEDPPATRARPGVGPEQGVIEEARRRRDARRARILTALVAAMIAGAVVWAYLSGGSDAASTPAARHPHAIAAGAGATGTRPAFNLRMWPSLGVGRAGWCMVVEEHRRPGVSACGPPVTVEAPIGFGFGRPGGPMTDLAVVGPQVAAVLVDGRRVATVRLPGLPYGLRALRVIATVAPRVVALDGSGRRLPERPLLSATQATVRAWAKPEREPHGPCRLHLSGLGGVSARGGTVATSGITPYPVPLVGNAFLPCISVEYQPSRTPLKAILLLDAAHPYTPPAALPNFRAVRGAPGIYAEGQLTARRSGPGWLVVEQGTGTGERIRLLTHLTATLRKP
jgi:hypothetical protein